MDFPNTNYQILSTSLSSIGAPKSPRIASDISDDVDFTRCYFLSPTWPCAVARWLCVCSRRGRKVHSKFLFSNYGPAASGSGFFTFAATLSSLDMDNSTGAENEHGSTLRIAMSRMPDPMGQPADFFLPELLRPAGSGL